MSEASRLTRLLKPRSIAIIGASDKSGALGASVLSNLDRQGFVGELYLINPNRTDIGGRACLPAVGSLPRGVDVAVLAIPRAAVIDTVQALAARDVGAAVIFSAGFAEGGAEGLADQRDIARIAADAGMVILGPNCLGLINFVDGTPLTFVELPAVPLGDRPGIAIVSQSGAMAAVLGVTLLSRDLGLSYLISTGNEAASGVEDYIDELIDDRDTRLIVLIVEQFRKPARLLAAARRARVVGKSIVLLHPGRSSAARESAATHTGAMAGDYDVMRVQVEHAGIVLVETLEELGDVAEILLRCPDIGAGGTAVLTESGAYKALTLDLAEQVGLQLPVMGDADSPELRAALPDFVPVSNPLDVTAQGLVDPDLYRRTVAALFADSRIGVILLAIIQTDAKTASLKMPPMIRAIGPEFRSKPVVFAGLDEGAAGIADYVRQIRAIGVPYFPTAERAVRALARVAAWRGVRHDDTSAALSVALHLPEDGGVIPEYRAKALLASTGIDFPPSRLVVTMDDALAAAERIGWPVVLKVQSAAVSHKSDVGGVIVGVRDVAQLRAGWAMMTASLARHRPGLDLDGILVEAMGRPGVELILGARNDPEWGAVLLIGFGGVQAELRPDVRLLPAELSLGAIIGELRKLKSAALFDGFRGSAALDIDAVATLAVKLGAVLRAAPAIREIDLNPVIVHAAGCGVTPLDALMLVAAAG